MGEFYFKNQQNEPHALQHNKIQPVNSNPYPPPDKTGDIALQLIDIKVYAYRVRQYSCVSSLHTHMLHTHAYSVYAVLRREKGKKPSRITILWLHFVLSLPLRLLEWFLSSFFGSSISFTPFVGVVFCFSFSKVKRNEKQFYDRFFFVKCSFNIFLIGNVKKANFLLKKKALNRRFYKQKSRWFSWLFTVHSNTISKTIEIDAFVLLLP